MTVGEASLHRALATKSRVQEAYQAHMRDLDQEINWLRWSDPRFSLIQFLIAAVYVLDRRGVLLPEDLVGDDPREHTAGDVSGRSGKRQCGKREKHKGTISGTVASYAIFYE
jgi:hypothetical protein